MIPWFAAPSLGMGPLSFDVANVLALVGVVSAMGLLRARARRSKLPVQRVLDSFGVVLVLGFVLGHGLDVVLYRTGELHADWRVLLPWYGGCCSIGAFLGLLFGVVLRFRRPEGGLRWVELDEVALAMLLGLVVLRVGCFVGHHHAGRLSTSLLAVAYPGGSRHDLGLLEAVLAAALLAGLLLVVRRAALRPGSVALGALCAYAAGRFGIEFLRGDDLEVIGRHSDARYAGLTLVQYGALLVVATCASWLGCRYDGGAAGSSRRALQ